MKSHFELKKYLYKGNGKEINNLNRFLQPAAINFK
jgi:hypothetical protein